MADLGPDGALSLSEFLASSAEPFWQGVRRELESRGVRADIALADGWRTADESFTFVAALHASVIEFTYEWPDGHPEAGRISRWDDAMGGPLARDFQHALRHARELWVSRSLESAPERQLKPASGPGSSTG